VWWVRSDVRSPSKDDDNDALDGLNEDDDEFEYERARGCAHARPTPNYYDRR
jgi:hypothetical protein